ncbi:hypothetical protein ZIOFF_013351 [Zingiber officinale]|uniref:Uncharacterized protein n=1 Tax=Zingiber officinale TaxID=94328 RepID=A0A8J5H9V0_ZINOF|nr:hypothetical protein ZIOFF_013351 [Zingiber officinale]
MPSSSTAVNHQTPGLKTCFKTPEGRYKLQYEKTHPVKAVSQLIIAYLKEKPTNQAWCEVRHFSNSNPVCHAFDSEVEDGHDLIIALHSGDVYSVSLRQQLQDPGRKLIAAQRYHKYGTSSNRHLNFAGYLRIFDFAKKQLKFGGKSYDGALLCCAWRYLQFLMANILTGGEDDLVQVWSIGDRKIVAWGEGHNSWVIGVAFDSYWSAPNSEVTGEKLCIIFVRLVSCHSVEGFKEESIGIGRRMIVPYFERQLRANIPPSGPSKQHNSGGHRKSWP